VAFLSSECEPWAKTGGLADVVDALARAIGGLGDDAIDGPVDVFLPRYRACPSLVRTQSWGTPSRCPDPRSVAGSSEVTVIDVAADGYRLRLVDHPPAFDRAGYYGDEAGDYADNAWRFGLYVRAALETMRAEGRPVDVIHAHDWQAGPAGIFRDRSYATIR
jgi:starch synthase